MQRLSLKGRELVYLNGQEVDVYRPELYSPVFTFENNGIAAVVRITIESWGGIATLNFDDSSSATLLNADAAYMDLGGSMLSWTPHENSITYCLNREFIQSTDSEGNSVRLWETREELHQIDISSGNSKMLLGGTDYYYADPSWSRDGEWLAFTSNRDGQDMDVWIMDKHGDNLKKIFDCSPNNCGSPTFSPDGRTLAFVAGSAIYSVDLTASDPAATHKVIIEADAGITTLKWSPPLEPPNLEVTLTQQTGGQTYCLAWTATRACSVVINDGSTTTEVEASASLNISPTVTTTYTITATGVTGISEKRITVEGTD